MQFLGNHTNSSIGKANDRTDKMLERAKHSPYPPTQTRTHTLTHTHTHSLTHTHARDHSIAYPRGKQRPRGASDLRSEAGKPVCPVHSHIWVLSFSALGEGKWRKAREDGWTSLGADRAGNLIPAPPSSWVSHL